MAFVLPVVHDNEDGWGPINIPDEFKESPTIYTPFAKSDKLGKAADWAKQEQNQGRYQGRYQQFGSNVATAFNWYHVDDEESFQVVMDRVAKPKKRFPQRQVRTQRPQQNRQTDNRQQSQQQQQQQQQQGKGGRRGGKTQNPRYNNQQPSNISFRRGGPMWGDNNQRRSKESSIDVRPDWVVLEQIDFPNLNRLAFDAPEPEDVVSCGSVGAFDKLYDRITTKTEKPLQKTDVVFPNVTTTDDPVIRKLAMDGAANVFATDAILAHLMACTRSSASWDIVVQRVGTKLFFDKRDGSAFDFVTVNETSHEQPSEDKDTLNTPQVLSQEATNINHYYSQQALSASEAPLKFPQPNPFAAEGERAATFGYRYRKWQLGEDVALIARCEVDAYTKGKDNEDSFLTVKSLHEFDPKITGVDWRQKLDSQKGAVLATELKNNSFKIAKWTAEALLAGSQQLKIGYVSRVNPKDTNNHVILGSQTFQAKEFATQINLNVRNMWGVVRTLVDMCLKLPPGRYIFVKDPYKPLVRLYEVPPDAFEEADDNAGDGDARDEKAGQDD